ncbi:phage tail protein I [Billgrantia montanilacus]|uniref:Phage tail protein I n=1 Tax=Billgrantia montanilacus TaxID=2282305 RepID=A0A368TY82_9GAMM|nr:phage tail protein I [Halomonas montanilacus]RCV89720.1 phage tail protein I [Halomonas montanilacus]
MNNKPLLPPNGTPLERAAAEALAEIQRVPVLLRQLWNPYTCPAPLLPYLAWAFSVDRWDPAWSTAAKREVIATSFFVHRKKGTIAALRRVVEPLGYLLEVTEWWQQDPMASPGTFALRIGVLDTGITEAMFLELERLIDDAKPLTRHITGLDITLSSDLTTYVGVAINDGDELDVLPWDTPDINVACHIGHALALTTTDTLDVYPYD